MKINLWNTLFVLFLLFGATSSASADESFRFFFAFGPGCG